MQSITIDILNSEAVKLLQNLEALHLIRMHKENYAIKAGDFRKHKGSMTKQSEAEIDRQLKELRSEWE